MALIKFYEVFVLRRDMAMADVQKKWNGKILIYTGTGASIFMLLLSLLKYGENGIISENTCYAIILVVAIVKMAKLQLCSQKHFNASYQFAISLLATLSFEEKTYCTSSQIYTHKYNVQCMLQPVAAH